MAVQVKSAFPFVSGSDTSRTLTFRVYGTTADFALVPYEVTEDTTFYLEEYESAAADAAFAFAPDFRDSLAKRVVSSITHIADAKGYIAFDVDVTYGELQSTEPVPQPVGTVEISYSTVLEQVHADYSISVINTFPVGLTGIETYGTTVGVVPNDPTNIDVTGYDKLIPRNRIRLDWTLTGATITEAVRKGWQDTVGKVNSDAYSITGEFSYEAGEVLFLGLTSSLSYSNGSERNSFEFEVATNVHDVPAERKTVSGIAGIWKDGFDLLDPVYRVTESPDSGKNRLTIAGFKVHRIFEYVSFANAKMPGTGWPP